MTDTNWNVHTRSVVSRLAAAESALNRSEAENARLRDALADLRARTCDHCIKHIRSVEDHSFSMEGTYEDEAP